MLFRKYKDAFLLGQRYKRLKNKKEVNDLNHHLNLVLNELVRSFEKARAEDKLTKKEEEHLERLKRMKGEDLTSSEAMMEKGMLLPEDVERIRDEVKEITQIESIEARERYILEKIEKIVKEIGPLFNDVPGNLNDIMAAVQWIDRLEQEYFQLQQRSKTLVNDEELRERERLAHTTDPEKMKEKDELEEVYSEEEEKEEIDSSEKEVEAVDDAEAALRDTETTDYYVSKGEDDAFSKGDVEEKKSIFKRLLRKKKEKEDE